MTKEEFLLDKENLLAKYEQAKVDLQSLYLGRLAEVKIKYFFPSDSAKAQKAMNIKWFNNALDSISSLYNF